MKSEISGISSALLKIPYWLFQKGVFLKNAVYDWDLRKPVEVEAKVISVGGISFGGAGKTPMTIYLAQSALKLASKIGKTAVISRGYRRKSKGFLLVSDGKKILTTVEQAGDELTMIAQRLPKLIVAADEIRRRGAKRVIERFKVKNIILDDCFQHRQIKRQIDIVMLEAETILNPNKYYLREPLYSVGRADMVVILDADMEQRESILRELDFLEHNKIFFGRRRISDIYDFAKDKKVRFGSLQNANTFAFCALAEPKRFLRNLNEIGIYPRNNLTFPDHCRYTIRDIYEFVRKFAEEGFEAMITTEKDAVKLSPILKSLPLYYTTLELEIEKEDEFIELVFG